MHSCVVPVHVSVTKAELGVGGGVTQYRPLIASAPAIRALASTIAIGWRNSSAGRVADHVPMGNGVAARQALAVPGGRGAGLAMPAVGALPGVVVHSAVFLRMGECRTGFPPIDDPDADPPRASAMIGRGRGQDAHRPPGRRSNGIRSGVPDRS